MVTTAEDLSSSGASWGAPRWTQRMYVSSGGLDHPGLASVVQDRLLPALSPGINVVTVHPRYWSFFTFVIDEFWQLDGPKTTRALNAFLRQRESIYGTACLLCSNHGTDIRQVVGYNKLSHRVGQQPADGDARCASEVAVDRCLSCSARELHRKRATGDLQAAHRPMDAVRGRRSTNRDVGHGVVRAERGFRSNRERGGAKRRLRITASLKPESRDKWRSYRMHFRDLPGRILAELEDMEASGT